MQPAKKHWSFRPSCGGLGECAAVTRGRSQRIGLPVEKLEAWEKKRRETVVDRSAPKFVQGIRVFRSHVLPA